MIPFSPPDIYPEIIDEVVETLKSGWITTGPRTKDFEKKISQYTGARSTVCVNSATAGLELALRWFGVGEGDEVIVPAYTYCASANVVLHCGAKVVMVDVGSDFNIDVEAIKRGITKNTKVIIPVDFAGYPADYDAIHKLVDQKEIKELFHPANDHQRELGRIMILADAAHSFGALYKGEKSGVLADMSVFSFHAVKNLTTSEGGAVCLKTDAVDAEAWYTALCIKSLHGQNKDALAKTKIGNWKYDVLEAGYKWNMTDIQAAIGLIGLKNYDSRTLVRRKAIFDTYNAAFSAMTWAQVPEYHTDSRTSSYHLYPLRIKGISEEHRDAIIQGIFEKGVSVNVHFPPLPILTVYRDLGYDISHYPVTYDNYAREISLPVYYALSDIQLKEVIEAVRKSVAEIL
jgi:dTDP-4-amino-4,6-dideoxygalactose transaminase